MHENIRLLKELQDIDYWIGELERSKEFLPDMMKNLQSEIEQVKTESVEKKARLQQAQIELRELEIRIAENKELRQRYQDQMLTIKTNKEYDALVEQIEAAKTQISLDEEQSLVLMTEIDQLKTAVTELEAKDLTIHDVNGEKLRDLQSQIESVQDKMSEKEAHRDHLVTKVPKQILSVYERIRKGRGGDVVVRLRRGACGECYKAQPPQKIQMVKRGDTIQTCSSCGRILIWEGED